MKNPPWWAFLLTSMSVCSPHMPPIFASGLGAALLIAGVVVLAKDQS